MSLRTRIQSKIFHKFPEYMNDVHDIKYWDAMAITTTFKDATPMFCDSFILRRKVGTDKSDNIAVQQTLAAIRAVFKDEGITVNAKYLYSKAGCMYFRVAASEVGFTLLMVILPATILPRLSRDNIVLDNLDITIDVSHISNRKEISEYLASRHLADTIVDDRRFVGDNCISFMQETESDERVRIKIYNKLVQMMESNEVRADIGSRLSDLVSNPSKEFTKILLDKHDTGLSRIEVTLFSEKIYDITYYEELMDDVCEILAECPAYCVSFDQQWTLFTERIQQSLFLIFPSMNTIGYCHWWNQVTGKKNGIIKHGVPQDKTTNIICNYSFNTRPIHVITFPILNDYNTYEHVTYIRESDTITLTVGKKNGMCPRRTKIQNSDEYQRDFCDYGLIHVNNIHISWPTRRYSLESPPLTSVKPLPVDSSSTPKEPSNGLDTLNIVNSKDYLIAFHKLKPGCSYVMVAHGAHRFRKKDYLIIKTACGLVVRCDDILQELLQPFIERNERATFHVVRCKIIDSKDMLECVIIQP